MTPSNYIYPLPKAILFEVMLSAIDQMQAYNGRSISECIVIAVGGEVIEGEDKDGKYKMTFTMPPLSEIKKTFK